MHFQKQEQYGLLLMGELANTKNKAIVSLVEMSRRHGVSVPFLKKIARSLRKSGLVQSKEGIGGGYMLTRKPEHISLWEIVSSLHGANGGWKQSDSVCPVNKNCLPQHIRSVLTECIRKRLQRISLHEAVQ